MPNLAVTKIVSIYILCSKLKVGTPFTMKGAVSVPPGDFGLGRGVALRTANGKFELIPFIGLQILSKSLSIASGTVILVGTVVLHRG